MGARNRVGIGLSYRPTRLHKLSELALILGLNKSLKIRVVQKKALKNEGRKCKKLCYFLGICIAPKWTYMNLYVNIFLVFCGTCTS
jgi:hypothetical protein